MMAVRGWRLYAPFKCLAALPLLAGMLFCGGSNNSQTVDPPPVHPTRTYRMGCSSLPPKIGEAAALASIDMWSKRADTAIFHFEGCQLLLHFLHILAIGRSPGNSSFLPEDFSSRAWYLPRNSLVLSTVSICLFN